MALEILSEWEHILKECDIRDVQYTRKYASLYGKPIMLYTKDNNDIAFLIIIVNEQFSDFETPYGYGGFYSSTDSKAFLKTFFSNAMDYFNSRGIIAGIIRFNPLHPPTQSIIDTLYIRDVAVLDTAVYPDLMTAKCRNMIKRGMHNGMHYSHSCNDDDRRDFVNAYRALMSHVNADPLLSFDNDYFHELFDMHGSLMIVCRDDKNRFRGGAVFLIREGGIAHYHLAVHSGQRVPGMSNTLLDMGINEAKSKNAHTMIMGGGVTSDKNDSLLSFKLSFGSSSHPFCLGKIIVDKEAYSEKIEHYDRFNDTYKNYVLRYRYGQ